MEQVLVEKMYGKMNKEEMWLSIEPILKSFLDESFESMFIYILNTVFI